MSAVVPRLASGRKPRRAIPVSAAVSDLIKVAQSRTPQDVAYWLYKYVGERIDEELESLATYFIQEDFADIIQSTEVQAVLSRGRVLEGMQLAMSRQRRRVSKTLRDHQRSEDDAFLDSCIQE